MLSSRNKLVMPAPQAAIVNTTRQTVLTRVTYTNSTLPHFSPKGCWSGKKPFPLPSPPFLADPCVGFVSFLSLYRARAVTGGAGARAERERDLAAAAPGSARHRPPPPSSFPAAGGTFPPAGPPPLLPRKDVPELSSPAKAVPCHGAREPPLAGKRDGKRRSASPHFPRAEEPAPIPAGAEGAERGQGSGQQPHLGAALRRGAGDSGGRGPARPAPRPPWAPPGRVPGGRPWLPAGRRLPSAWRGPRRSPACRASAAGGRGWGWRPATAAAAAARVWAAATLCSCLGSGRPSPHSPRRGRGAAPEGRGAEPTGAVLSEELPPPPGRARRPRGGAAAGGLVVTGRGGGRSSLRRRRRRPLRPAGHVGVGAALPAGRGAAPAGPAPPRRSRTRRPGARRAGGGGGGERGGESGALPAHSFPLLPGGRPPFCRRSPVWAGLSPALLRPRPPTPLGVSVTCLSRSRAVPLCDALCLNWVRSRSARHPLPPAKCPKF